MAELVYLAIQSLDGYIADEQGDFGWGEPDEEAHAFINDLTRPVGTYLLGRRMYEVMAVWERPEEFVGSSPAMRDFAEVWQAAEKVVYSRTLDSVSTERTRLERDFDPARVAALKESSERPLSIAGPTLAAHAFSAGLVDELQLFIAPVIIGGGKQSLPAGVRLDLEPAEERRFSGGLTFLRYRTPHSAGATRRSGGARP